MIYPDERILRRRNLVPVEFFIFVHHRLSKVQELGVYDLIMEHVENSENVCKS